MQRLGMAKVGAEMAGAGTAIARTAHNTKQDGKISDLEKHMKALTYEIGRLTVLSMDNGTDVGQPVAERYAKITAAREEIRAIERSKRRTKEVCPHCGEKILAGMSYCGACGKPLAR